MNVFMAAPLEEHLTMPAMQADYARTAVSSAELHDLRNDGKKRTRNRRKADNPAQSKRFEDAVRNLGLGESGEAFKRAMDKIAPKKGGRNGNNN